MLEVKLFMFQNVYDPVIDFTTNDICRFYICRAICLLLIGYKTALKLEEEHLVMFNHKCFDVDQTDLINQTLI